MNKMVELANNINEREFKFGERSMNQTERNALKKEVLDTLLETFDGAGLDVERVNDGVILQANKQVVITFDAVIKNIDYDVDFEKSEYELKLEKQLERELERKRKAESKK